MMISRSRRGSSSDTAVLNLWHRELGDLSPRTFAHRFAASKDLVLRFNLLRKLNKHRGCVNTISFSQDGDLLVSGSDDLSIIFWDWEFGHAKLLFHSGHSDNVFQAMLMPCRDDRHIVTCAADGQVRYAEIKEHGQVETKLLGKHQGIAHKLAVEPGNPHMFYSCGEDGLVQHFDLRTEAVTRIFSCKPFHESIHLSVLPLNSIAIDPRNPNFFAVAGLDEFARLYDIRKCNWNGSTNFGQPVDLFCPPHLIGEELEITGLAFSGQSELLATYFNEFIYLFTREMGLGPDPVVTSLASVESDASEMENNQAEPQSNKNVDSEICPQVYKGHTNQRTVKGVNFFGPKSEYVVSGSDCGRVFIWNKKDAELIRVMEADKHVVNCIESHPNIPVLVSSGIESSIKIWTPKAVKRATVPKNFEMAFDDLEEEEEDDDSFYSEFSENYSSDNDYDSDDHDDDSSCSDFSEDYNGGDENDDFGRNPCDAGENDDDASNDIDNEYDDEMDHSGHNNSD